MNISEFKEFLPNADGSTRRRLLSGFVVVGAAVPFFWNGNIKELLEAAGVENATVAIGAILLIYGIGLLNEILMDAVLIRAFGGAIWAANLPTHTIHAETAIARWILRGLAYYFVVPVYALWGVFRGLAGSSMYVADVPRCLKTSKARAVFRNLPEWTSEGLRYPYGDSFDSAWSVLAAGLNEASRTQVQKLHARNRDILALVGALAIVSVLVFGHASPSFAADLDGLLILNNSNGMIEVPALAIPILILFPVLILAIHHRFHMSVIVCCIEMCALEMDSTLLNLERAGC